MWGVVNILDRKNFKKTKYYTKLKKVEGDGDIDVVYFTPRIKTKKEQKIEEKNMEKI